MEDKTIASASCGSSIIYNYTVTSFELNNQHNHHHHGQHWTRIVSRCITAIYPCKENSQLYIYWITNLIIDKVPESQLEVPRIVKKDVGERDRSLGTMFLYKQTHQSANTLHTNNWSSCERFVGENIFFVAFTAMRRWYPLLRRWPSNQKFRRMFLLENDSTPSTENGQMPCHAASSAKCKVEHVDHIQEDDMARQHSVCLCLISPATGTSLSALPELCASPD